MPPRHPTPPPVSAPPTRSLDLRGERCPYTFIKARLAIEDLRLGDTLEVVLDFVPAFTRVPASMAVIGQTLLQTGSAGTDAKRLLFRKDTE
ncbi:MAG: sulfurtransferase TusA family protein [Planctomycetes bacterium]|nr:sulfurtransferase TusA family protein [Planctomycetota bacterium]